VLAQGVRHAPSNNFFGKTTQAPFKQFQEQNDLPADCVLKQTDIASMADVYTQIR
jgi:hypothetical protein